MQPEDRPASSAFKIVVVEESPDLAAAIAATLRREGFQAHIAGDVETGLEMTESLRADLVVLDVRAMQRRPRAPESSPSLRRFGDLTIEPETQRVRVGGAAIELSRIEYRLLSVLSGGGTRTTTRAELLRRVWGEGWVGDDHLVDVHISNLRHKLGDDPTNPSYITTVRGRGFSMRRG